MVRGDGRIVFPSHIWGVASDQQQIRSTNSHETAQIEVLVRVISCEFVDRFSWSSANRGIEQIDIVAI